MSINNHLSVHKTDFLDLYIENGMIHAILLDTEDYNNLIEFAPKLLQDAGIIKNYYFMVEIETPLKDILPKID